jgi:chromosome segregation ATPase
MSEQDKEMIAAARRFCEDWPYATYHPNDLTLFYEAGWKAASERNEALFQALLNRYNGLDKRSFDDIQTLRTKLAEIEQEREVWGNEFSAVVAMKEKLATAETTIEQKSRYIDYLQLELRALRDKLAEKDKIVQDFTAALDAAHKIQFELKEKADAESVRVIMFKSMHIAEKEKLARAEALMERMQWVIENYIMYADAYPEDAGDALRALAKYRESK